MSDLLTARVALEPLRSDLTRLGITSIRLFGSRAKGTEQPWSDWDLLVDFSRPISCAEYWQLKAQLISALQGPVDLSSPQYCEANYIKVIQPESIEVYHA